MRTKNTGQMETDGILDKETNTELKPCSVCGRTFNPSSLARHETICEKTKLKSRKVFDSSHQRVKGVNPVPVKPPKQEETKKSKSTWKTQQDELLRTVRKEKDNSDYHQLEGRRPQQKVIPLGHSQCPVCRRCFNHKAADRHISWCQEQLTRLPKSPPSSEALMRLRARIQYRAPLPGRKRFSLADGQRLIKSAEACKSATLPRTHSSPYPSNTRSATKQVGFLLPSETSMRRRSCERSTFERDEIVYQNYNTLPLKSSFRRPSSQPQHTNVKFKEKFPQYNNNNNNTAISSRKAYDNYQKEEEDNMYYVDSFPNISEPESIDILSALKLQLAELQISQRYQKSSSKSNKNANVNFPAVCGNELSPAHKKNCDVLVVDAEYRCSGSSSSDTSLPTVSVSRASSARMPRFCYQCGTKYPVTSAKYCCECGTKRLDLSQCVS